MPDAIYLKLVKALFEDDEVKKSFPEDERTSLKSSLDDPKTLKTESFLSQLAKPTK
jgi:hypothetical protein